MKTKIKMAISPRHRAPPRHLPPRQMSSVTPDPALHYPLQHYNAIRITSIGQTKPVIRKDREQPTPNLLYQSDHAHRGPFVISHSTEIGTPLLSYYT